MERSKLDSASHWLPSSPSTSTSPSPLPAPSQPYHPHSEPFLDPLRPPRTRPRLVSRSRRSIRSLPRRTYRQVTLPECLNTSPSSPLGPPTRNPILQSGSPSRYPSFITPSNRHRSDAPHASDPIHRPPLAPLLFDPQNHARLTNRSRLDSSLPDSSIQCDPPTPRPSISHDLSCSSPVRNLASHPSYVASSPPNPYNIPRPPLPAIDPFFESELSYKKPSHFGSSKRTQFAASLESPPQTHTIKIWNSEYEHGYEFPFSLSFNHKARTGQVGAPPAQGELLAIASALGTISLYRPSEIGPAEDRSPITTFEAIQNGIFALTFSSSDSMLATGSGAQLSEIFDVESGSVIGRLGGHGGTVKTVEFSPYNEQIIVTGSRDGSIKVWDLRTVDSQAGDDGVAAHPPVITIQNAHDEKYTGRKRKKGVHIPSVSSVLWSRLADRHLYSAGSANGVVKLWDIRNKSQFNSKKAHPSPADQSIDHQTTSDLSPSIGREQVENGNFTSDGLVSQRQHGISSLVSTSDGARIYALGTDSRPPSSQLRSFSYPSLIATSLYLKLTLSQDDAFLGCSSSTGEIYIWDTTPPTPDYQSHAPDFDEYYNQFCEDNGIAKKTGSEDGPVILFGHQEEVCALQFWRQGLGSCCDDSSIRIWTYHHAHLQTL